MSQTECVLPLFNSLCWNPVPSLTVLGGWIFGKWSGLDEAVRVPSNSLRYQCPSKTHKELASTVLSSTWGYNTKPAIWKSGSRSSPDLVWGHLNLELAWNPPELWKTNVCYLSHPVWDYFLEWAERYHLVTYQEHGILNTASSVRECRHLGLSFTYDLIS